MATTELRTGTKVVQRPKPLHWVALGLLVLSVCINYVDRGNLGVAAKSIEGELHFSQPQLGVLLGGFAIGFRRVARLSAEVAGAATARATSLLPARLRGTKTPPG